MLARKFAHPALAALAAAAVLSALVAPAWRSPVGADRGHNTATLVPAPRAAAPLPLNPFGGGGPAIGARAAVVLDDASGAVLYERSPHLALPPASLTKIATAVLAIERGRLGESVDIRLDHRELGDSTVMGLLPGDRFTMRDLLYGLMLPSGNDAALAISRAIAATPLAFSVQMIDLAKRLGLRHTSFVNPHGLDEPAHLSSAYDLAILARYAMTLPEFARIVRARTWTATGERTIELRNVNRFLDAYPGADGVKTGFTEGAGRSLVATATRDGHRLYVVILNSPTRDQDAAALLDWAFANHVWR